MGGCRCCKTEKMLRDDYFFALSLSANFWNSSEKTTLLAPILAAGTTPAGNALRVASVLAASFASLLFDSLARAEAHLAACLRIPLSLHPSSMAFSQ